MAAEQPQVQQAPISGPRPGLGPDSVRPGTLTRRDLSGYAVRGTTWLRLPGIARTAADLQARRPWAATLILAGMAVLAVHLVFYPWPDLPQR